MKKFKNEIRIYLAEWLLGKIVVISPKETKDGQELISLIGFYFCTKLNNK